MLFHPSPRRQRIRSALFQVSDRSEVQRTMQMAGNIEEFLVLCRSRLVPVVLR